MFDMDLGDIPLFSMLRGRLGYLSQRQKLIAENVANADTPGFAPKDLKAFSFQQQLQSAGAVGAMKMSQPGHMQPKSVGSSGARGAPAFKGVKSPDSETTLDGNSVVLEEEMMKMSDARMNYDAAIGFYQKSLNMLRLAAKRPGG